MYFFSRVLNHLIKVTLSHTITSQFRIQLPTSTWLGLQVSATPPSTSSSKQASFVRLTWVSQHSKLHCYWIMPWHDLLYSLGREEFIQTSFRLIINTYLTWINALPLFPGGSRADFTDIKRYENKTNKRQTVTTYLHIFVLIAVILSGSLSCVP